jgi:hypothetical protein
MSKDEEDPASRRSGLEMRVAQRRAHPPKEWTYFEKRSGEERRKGSDRRLEEEKAAAAAAD